MHRGAAAPSVDMRVGIDWTEVREPLAMASFVVGLWRNIRACEGVTRAIERWGYSRNRTRIDIFELQRVGRD
jgi:hypothetical protein